MANETSEVTCERNRADPETAPTAPPIAVQPSFNLTRDAQGKIVMEPVAPAGSAPQTVKHSFFEDDQGEGLESGVVMLDSAKVWVRELTAAEAAAYSQGEREIADMMRDLAKAKEEAEALALSESIQKRQIELYNAVVLAGVARWELTRPDGAAVPCTPETKQKLRISKRAELSDKIVRRSAIGRDLGDFLGA